MKKGILIILTVVLVTSAWATGFFKYYDGKPMGYERLPKGDLAWGIRIDEKGFTTITKIMVSIAYYSRSTNYYPSLQVFDTPSGNRYINYPIRLHQIKTEFKDRKEYEFQWYTADNLNWSVPSTRPIFVALIGRPWFYCWFELHKEEKPRPISGKSFEAVYSAYVIENIKPVDKDWFIEIWTNGAHTNTSGTSLGRVKAIYR